LQKGGGELPDDLVVTGKVMFPESPEEYSTHQMEKYLMIKNVTFLENLYLNHIPCGDVILQNVTAGLVNTVGSVFNKLTIKKTTIKTLNLYGLRCNVMLVFGDSNIGSCSCVEDSDISKLHVPKMPLLAIQYALLKLGVFVEAGSLKDFFNSLNSSSE
jgi:hypothetical protein